MNDNTIKSLDMLVINSYILHDNNVKQNDIIVYLIKYDKSQTEE